MLSRCGIRRPLTFPNKLTGLIWSLQRATGEEDPARWRSLKLRGGLADGQRGRAEAFRRVARRDEHDRFRLVVGRSHEKMTEEGVVRYGGAPELELLLTVVSATVDESGTLITANRGFRRTDANGNPLSPVITNQMTNFGWEYVWHCHILSHEEMDMMRPVSVLVGRQLAAAPFVTLTRAGLAVRLDWTDGTSVTADPKTWGDLASEVGFRIERATVTKNGKVGTYAVVGTALANTTTSTDPTADATTIYSYRVVAYNAAGSTPSAAVLTAPVAVLPAPSNLTATLQSGPRLNLSFRDNATNETGFTLERATDGAAFAVLTTLPAQTGTGNVTAVDSTIAPGHAYQYRVSAVNAGGPSGSVTSVVVIVPSVPLAPTGLSGSATLRAAGARVTLLWIDNATNETGFTLQRATNAALTTGLNVTSLAANTTTVNQNGLPSLRTYYYRVQASNLAGVSGWSNVFSIKTP